jgi:hypothetical protein
MFYQCIVNQDMVCCKFQSVYNGLGFYVGNTASLMNKSSQLLLVNISTVRLSVPLDDCFTVMPKKSMYRPCTNLHRNKQKMKQI